jgi:hypothetical protein
MYLKCEGTLTQRRDAQWLCLVTEDGNTISLFTKEVIVPKDLWRSSTKYTNHFHLKSLPILPSFCYTLVFTPTLEKNKNKNKILNKTYEKKCIVETFMFTDGS